MLVIWSTAAEKYLVTRQMVREAITERKSPLLCIEISVPRNIDPAVAGFQRFRLRLDDLNHDFIQNRERDVKRTRRIDC